MVNLKCDETCKGGDNCTNSRIYISGLPKGCTADDITDMFGAWARSPGSAPGPRRLPGHDALPREVLWEQRCLLPLRGPARGACGPQLLRRARTEGLEAPRRDGREEAEPRVTCGVLYTSGGQGPVLRLWRCGARRRAASWQLRPAGGQLRRRRRLRWSAPRRPPGRGRLRPPRPARDYDRRDRRDDAAATGGAGRAATTATATAGATATAAAPPVPLALARPAPRRLLTRARASTPELRRVRTLAETRTRAIFAPLGAVEPLWLPCRINAI